MEITSYIEQAKVTYPNGYADYITKYPQDTPISWNDIFDIGYSKEVKVGEFFTITDFSDMDTWSNEKLWTFLGWIEYNSNK